MAPRSGSRLLVAFCLLAFLLLAAAPRAVAVPTLVGPSSWYGGPCDSQSGSTTASGIPLSVPGFASRAGAPYGDRWIVTGPDNVRALAVHLDHGPAAWTGRVIDLDSTLVALLGYGPGPCHDYPTGAIVSAFQVVEFHYPACSPAAGIAVRQLHRLQHRHGRHCITGPEVQFLARWQHRQREYWSAGHHTVTWATWRRLFNAR